MLLLPLQLLAEQRERDLVFSQARAMADSLNKPLLNAGCGITYWRAIMESDVNMDVVPRDVPNFVLSNAEGMSRFYDKQFGAVFCLASDTLVLGGNEPIQCLSMGSRVLGHDGNIHRVIQPMSRFYTGQMVQIKASGLPVVEITPEHPVLTASIRRRHIRSWSSHNRGRNVYMLDIIRAWKRANDVQAHDWVIVPRRKDCTPSAIDIVVPHGNQHRPYTSVEHLSLTPEIAWLLGLYTAEGSLGQCSGRHPSYRIVFNLGAHEVKLAERTGEIMSHLGIHTSVYRLPNFGCMRVHAYSKGWSHWLAEHIGTSSYTKHVPEVIKAASSDIIKSFIDGWFNGDGYNENGTKEVTTVSPILAMDGVEMLIKLGIPARVFSNKPHSITSMGRVLKCAISYRVRWPERVETHELDGQGRRPYFSQARIDNDAAYYRVEAVNSTMVVNRAVYNIRTTAETYGVPFIVHNCSHVLEHVNDLARAKSELERVADYQFVITPSPLFLSSWLLPKHKRVFNDTKGMSVLAEIPKVVK